MAGMQSRRPPGRALANITRCQRQANVEILLMTVEKLWTWRQRKKNLRADFTVRQTSSPPTAAFAPRFA